LGVLFRSSSLGALLLFSLSLFGGQEFFRLKPSALPKSPSRPSLAIIALISSVPLLAVFWSWFDIQLVGFSSSPTTYHDLPLC
jgi:hypothetical protein